MPVRRHKQTQTVGRRAQSSVMTPIAPYAGVVSLTAFRPTASHRTGLSDDGRCGTTADDGRSTTTADDGRRQLTYGDCRRWLMYDDCLRPPIWDDSRRWAMLDDCWRPDVSRLPTMADVGPADDDRCITMCHQCRFMTTVNAI